MDVEGRVFNFVYILLRGLGWLVDFKSLGLGRSCFVLFGMVEEVGRCVFFW